MLKPLAVLGSLVLLLAACGAGTTNSTEESEAAQSTVASVAASRTIHLDIGDGKITPASVTVTKGETVTFEAKNVSNTEVELIVGLKTDVASDSGDSLVEAEEIMAGETKTLTFTFDGDGPYAYGDQIGDHYAKGAKGDIVLQ